MTTSSNTKENENTKNDGCKLCRYFMADPVEAPMLGFYCFCENSPLFGKIVRKVGEEASPGCECHEKATYTEMSLKEALKIVTDTDHKITNAAWDHRKDKDGHPVACLWFKTNEDIENWRDAYCRLFEEAMKYMRTDGEFEDEIDGSEDNLIVSDCLPEFKDLHDRYMYREIGHHEFARELGVKESTLDRLIKEFTESAH